MSDLITFKYNMDQVGVPFPSSSSILGLQARQPVQMELKEGDAITIRGVSSSNTGTVNSPTGLQSYSLGAGASIQVGPYAGRQKIAIVGSLGSIDATVGDAALGVPAVTANGDLTIQGAGSFTLTKQRVVTLAALGDSTFGYANVASPSASSVTYNGDGTATAVFGIDQGLRVGDIIGSQGAVDRAYNVAVGAKILTVSGSGPYSYTYPISPMLVPQTSPDSGSAFTFMFEHQKSAYCLLGNLRYLAGPQFKILNIGIGGDTSSDMLARFDRDVKSLSPAPEEVMVTFGINDIYKGLPAATSQANLEALWKKIKGIGARMRLVAMPPQPSTRSGWTTTTRDAAIALRKYMKIWAQSRGVAFHDWSAVSAGSESAQNPTDANANPNTGMINSGDGVHPTNKLGYMLAKEIASDLFTIYPVQYKGLPSNITDGGLMSNPLFTGSGGTAPIAPVSGTIPDNCAVTVTAGSPTSVVCSQVARTVAADGDTAGNNFQIVFTAAAAGDQIRIALESLHSKMVNGATYRFAIQAKITGGGTLCKELSFTCTEQNNGAINIIHTIQAISGTQAAAWPENISGILADDITTRSSANVPGSLTNFQPRILVTAAAAGAITIQLAKVGCDLVTS